jgi:hypothetical protein
VSTHTSEEKMLMDYTETRVPFWCKYCQKIFFFSYRGPFIRREHVEHVNEAAKKSHINHGCEFWRVAVLEDKVQA